MVKPHKRSRFLWSKVEVVPEQVAIVIVGAGAPGLMCAFQAGQRVL